MKIYLSCLLVLLTTISALGQSNEIKRSYLSPKRIVWQSDDSDRVLKNTDLLLKPGIHQADLYGGGYSEFVGNDSLQASVILDFGKEIQGGIQLVTAGFPGNTPIKVRLRFGESVSETMSEVGQDGATNDHAIRDFELLLPWMGKMEAGSSGFRFVRIDLLDTNRNLYLKEVSAISELRDIPYLGSFECDDERLNQIWQTGAYTVHLNMQEYLWDGIKRDRLVWVGDMHPEVMTINSVFGYNEVVPKSLDYIRSVTPASSWMNGISSYSMWWILIQKDWYMANGDIDYLNDQKTYLTELLSKLCSMVDKDGQEHLDGTRFLDWPSSGDNIAVDAGYQSLLLMTLEAGAYLLDELKEQEIAALCNKTAKRMESAKVPVTESKQGVSLLSLAGLKDKDEAADIITKDHAKKFSTFYGYYMLEALAKAERHKAAMSIVNDYWGAMLDLGATTFWEDFNIDWMENAGRIDELPQEGTVDVHRKYGDYCYKGLRHSFCHGWASGPTAWLSQHVLGVSILEPGCRKVKIDPHLVDLQWVKGSFPTPLGAIKIEHKRLANGKVETKVDAPKGIKVVYK
ncbi:MAG: hypothetical protein N4A74_18425 [Carboxylicivirga sp.]|jgi:hypothetical protein|nr:hypothetical protein [Carboxylicivirga sp.]